MKLRLLAIGRDRSGLYAPAAAEYAARLERYVRFELARRVGTWLGAARDVALVMGGSDGLSAEVLARAGEKLALSRMTLAHRLARVVLLEQLYRAMTILRGEPYHK